MSQDILKDFPAAAPAAPSRKLQYADVAVTATAKEFDGIYRNKKQHENDLSAVLDRAHAAGVHKVMLTGMSLQDVPFHLNIAQSRPGQCSLTAGIHPYHASELETEGPEYMDKLVKTVQELLALTPCPIAAFGELGLDYDRLNHASKETQIHAFTAQLDLFVKHEFDLPLFLHCRAAFEDFVDVIGPYMDRLPRRGLVHSFVGTKDQMHVLADMGLEISVNGFCFVGRESLEMVREIPLERLQIETDAPYGEIASTSEVAKRYLVHAAPLPAAKKKDRFEMGAMVKGRNECCSMERVAFVVAGLKGVSVEEVAQAAWENSMRMFRLDSL